MNKKQLMDTVNQVLPKAPKEHGRHQMTLGSLIKALQRERTGLPVMLSSVYQGYEDKYPGMPHSYYGHHSDLAFKPSTEEITVAQFLKVCEDAMHSTFRAPDGSPSFYQDYTMIHNTPLWVSELDTASKTGITDVVPTDGHITLITETIKEDSDVPG